MCGTLNVCPRVILFVFSSFSVIYCDLGLGFLWLESLVGDMDEGF